MRSWPAWLVSLLLHSVIVIVIGAIWTSRTNGTGGEAERPVGVAVVHQAAGEESYLLSGSESSAAEANATDSMSESLAKGGEILASAQDAILSELLPGAVNAAGEAESAAGGIGLADGGSQLSGNSDVPKLKTTVFGIEGEGTRFLYVFDRSDSMNGYQKAPFRAAKSELSKSLQSLGEMHQFQIIFYNESPLPYGGTGSRGPSLLRGDENTKREALRFVRDIVALGGTGHVDALKMAIGMGPDVMFFLTDAEIPAVSQKDLEEIQGRASRAGTTIHTIQFGLGSNPNKGSSRGNWIRTLASITQGQFRYVDVTKLGQ